MPLAQEEIVLLLKLRDEASRALGRFEGHLGSIQRRAQALRLPLTIAFGAAAAGATLAVRAASDYDEAMNKASVTFGDHVDVVQEFARTSADAFGISKTAANEYSATLGVILKGSGLAEDAIADMSVDLVKLSADIASFNNLPIGVALEKIRAGLVGETEPLRTVGVLLNEAAVQQKAYALGIAEAGAKLTDAQKVQARYALILEQTTVQQGDFARTADGMANTMRRVQALLADLAVTIGTVLLPIALEVLQGTVLPALNNFSDWFIEHEAEIKSAVTAMADVAGDMFQSFKRGVETVMPLLQMLFSFIIDNKPVLIAAIVAIGAAMLLVFGPVGQIITAIGLVITAIGFLRDNWREVFNAIIGITEDAVNGIIKGLDALIDKIGDTIEFGLNPILGLASKFGIGPGEIQVLEGGLGLPPLSLDGIPIPPGPLLGRGTGLTEEELGDLTNAVDAASDAVDEAAGALAGSGGLKDAVDRLEEAVELAEDRRKVLLRKYGDELQFAATREAQARLESERAIRQETDARASLISTIANRGASIGLSAEQIVATIAETKRFNEAYGLDPLGNALPSAINPGEQLQPGWALGPNGPIKLDITLSEDLTIEGVP